MIGGIIAAILVAIFAVLFIWIVPLILIVVGIVWFFKSYLPKQFTGNVVADVQPRRAKPGARLTAHMEFTPKRRLSTNGVHYTVRCVEKCVSGSGSNRTTHTHELHTTSGQLADARVVPAGETQRFEFQYDLPATAAPSLKLSDNELLWTVEMRIGIPRWPDWSETINLIVEPTRNPSSTLGRMTEDSPEDKWLDEVLNQLEQSQDRERLEVVLQAIREHQFWMLLEFEGESAEVPDLALGIPGGWFDAYLLRRDWVVRLFVPRGMATPPVDTNWRCLVNILDFDPEEEILTLTALPDAKQPGISRPAGSSATT